MRSKEDFKREYMSEDCFYWSETLEETNQVIEVATYFGINSRLGEPFDKSTYALSRLTLIDQDDEIILQRMDMWNPRYGFNIRNESCMYAEFKELSQFWEK